ncbi:MAG TPA: hypothetical protein VNM22_06235 [Candidatus Limnocylindrales bacterium]|nr:hypothetical protein [Candidatus Limnocylindrales bacterium]
MSKTMPFISYALLFLILGVILGGCGEDESSDLITSSSTSSALSTVPSPQCGVTLSTDPGCGAIINRTDSTLRIAVDGSNGFEVEVSPHTALTTQIAIQSSHDFRVDVIDPSSQAQKTFQYFIFVDDVAADQIVDIGSEVFMGWFLEINDVAGQFSRMGG